MKKKDWYRDRLIWRAKKNFLTQNLWERFSVSAASDAKTIQACLEADADPVVVFWKSAELWTVVTGDTVVSNIGGEFSSILLDEINGHLSLNEISHSNARETKKTSECILVGEKETKIWAPSGNQLFGLMNMLKMFPLNVPEEI